MAKLLLILFPIIYLNPQQLSHGSRYYCVSNTNELILCISITFSLQKIEGRNLLAQELVQFCQN